VPTCLIRNARIFEGTCVLPYDAVLICDGTIAAVGKEAGLPTVPQSLDANGGTLLPGLIDAHVHAGIPNDALARALLFGVTTVLDMFMPVASLLAAKARQDGPGGSRIADLRSAGYCATAPGGHGTQYGFPIPTLNAAKEAHSFVAARIEEGSDYIKIMLEDREIFGDSIPTLGRDTLQALVASAHGFGKLAVAHVHTVDFASEALEARADGLAHVYQDRLPEPGLVETMAKRGVFVVPTLSVLESACGLAGGGTVADDLHLSPYLSPEEIAWLRRPIAAPNATPRHYFGVVQPAVRQLVGSGISVLAGTDAPNPGVVHGVSIHRELELLVDSGLTAVQALAAATAVPAAVFGLADRGRIAAGLRADLLLVEGDPTRDIRLTRDIKGVWKRGVFLDRERYLTN
jgi:imidazolonepropionase-like amidohydrolase